MNERLIVMSFGPIKQLDITFRKVTMFIGDQATGKSCVAKLFSMFKWLEKALSQKRYKRNYFEQYNRFLTKMCAYHRIETFIYDETFICYESSLYKFEYKEGAFSVTDKNGEVKGISKIMYVPAERSIVSVAEGKSKLLKELPDSSEAFSDEFVNAKKFFQNNYQLPFEDLRFEYDALNDTGWIRGADYRVRLINASSGIQSSLPMCMVADYLSQKTARREEVRLSKEERDRLEKRVADIIQDETITDSIKDIMIKQLSAVNSYTRFVNVVEEPELNLFPQSQMNVLCSLIATNSLSPENMLVITTHSPYTLAVMNMLIIGAKAYGLANDEAKTELESILPSRYYVRGDDFAAYRLSTKKEPYCESVVKEKTGMIAKNDLDSASDEIMRVYNSIYRVYANIISQ